MGAVSFGNPVTDTASGVHLMYTRPVAWTIAILLAGPVRP